MKIGIDISQIVYGTGVSRYTKNLVRTLLEIDTENRYVLFGGAFRRRSDLDCFFESLNYHNVSKNIVPLSPSMADFIWNKVHRLKIEKIIGKIDVYHTSDWTEPPSEAMKVTTVHDLAPILFPELTPKHIVDVHTHKLAWVKKESRAIIVPSESIKNDLLLRDFDPERLFVTPEAPDYQLQDQKKVAKVLSSYGIRKPYLLSVGVGFRKNTERILQSYKILKKDFDFQLVVIGDNTFFANEEGVIYTGFISDSDMAAMYTGAEVLLYPSLYEGFGIPILDAFNCSVPVVTSDRGSMREIAKDAAVLVDPEDSADIVKGVKMAISQKSDYIKKGQIRVLNYSWKKMAETTLGIYNAIRPE